MPPWPAGSGGRERGDRTGAASGMAGGSGDRRGRASRPYERPRVLAGAPRHAWRARADHPRLGQSDCSHRRTAGLLLGADDYVAKPFDDGELLARMRRSLGRAERGAPNCKGRKTPEGGTPLSPREFEILGLLSEGLRQADIAERLVLSPKTVGTHIQHILFKLGVHSRAQAVAEAYRQGLVQRDFAAHDLLVLHA